MARLVLPSAFKNGFCATELRVGLCLAAALVSVWLITVPVSAAPPTVDALTADVSERPGSGMRGVSAGWLLLRGPDRSDPVLPPEYGPSMQHAGTDPRSSLFRLASTGRFVNGHSLTVHADTACRLHTLLCVWRT